MNKYAVDIEQKRTIRLYVQTDDVLPITKGTIMENEVYDEELLTDWHTVGILDVKKLD